MEKMAETLFDLERSLRSDKVNTMTKEEENIIGSFKSKALRDFSIGTAATCFASWLATRKLSIANRIYITTGSAGFIGLLCFGRSLDSSVHQILSMEGKRIKDEMAKIVLMKYRDNPSVMHSVSQYFYSENVYDESSLDRPKLRWRVRTVFSDPVVSEMMRTQIDNPKNHNTPKGRTTAEEKIKMPQKQAYNNTTIDSMVDPFDYVLGPPQPMEGNTQPDASSVPPPQGTRSQRRSHRRHRKRHHKVSEEEAMLA